MTDAAVRDSQVVDDILDPDNTVSDVCADCAFGIRYMRYADSPRVRLAPRLRAIPPRRG